ncbi:MAG: aminopeptidase P family protein [Ruminococcaceae bacterium]|nr:aminopeptidase P family protein [Oscillospiraceae bacterium]
MYTTRINTLLSRLPNEADGVLITSPENLRYFSGFTGGEGALVLSGQEKKLLTDSRYVLQAAEEAPDFSVIDTAETKLLDCLCACDFKTLAIEEENLSAHFYKKLTAALPRCTFLGVDETLLLLRAVKNDAELDLTRKAARLADEAFAHVLPLIRPEVSELDIAMELEWHMRKGGADGPSFPIICASGYRSAMPHGVASEKKLASGELFTMDFGCFYHGYASDMTRTVMIGKASEKQRKIYDTVLAAQLAALSAIGPGVSGQDADAAARDLISAAGFGPCFGHSLGHGTGLLIHERPTLSPRSDSVLAPGMIVSVEPGIYVEGIGGVRIEDLVIITEDGIENLTTSPKELLEL